MTNITLFTDSKKTAKAFGILERSRTFTFCVKDLQSFKELEEDQRRESICFIDITGIQQKKLKRYITSLLKDELSAIAIVDPEGRISDTGALFHRGIVDFIGKPLLKEGLSAARFKNLAEFCSSLGLLDGSGNGATSEGFAFPAKQIDELRPSGKNWSRISQNEQYTFILVYFELDLNKDWKSKSGQVHIDTVMENFNKHTNSILAEVSGKAWMMTEHGALFLVPFDGTSAPVVEPLIKMNLNRVIYSAEEYIYNTLISYRTAVHVGNTVFREKGDTGTIISDAVNLIFHLNKQWMEPGDISFTDAAAQFIPACYKKLFFKDEPFEGHRLYTMQRPVQYDEFNVLVSEKEY